MLFITITETNTLPIMQLYYAQTGLVSFQTTYNHTNSMLSLYKDYSATERPEDEEQGCVREDAQTNRNALPCQRLAQIMNVMH